MKYNFMHYKIELWALVDSHKKFVYDIEANVRK